MKEWWKKICRVLKRRLPSVSRTGKVIRNFVFVLLAVVLFWWAVGTPALTPQWRYRRAERRNMIQDSEIKAVVETEWINWETHELVVGENKDSYFICLTDEPFYAMYLQGYEKQGDVTLTGAPESFYPHYYFESAIPFLVLTELPAVKAELELVIPPELSWRWVDMEGRESFAGAVCRGEDYNEDGVFTFCFPSGLVDVEPGANDPDLTDQMVMQWDALHIFSQTLLGVRQKDYGCAVEARIRLWDAQGQLIYDETLIYDIKG